MSDDPQGSRFTRGPDDPWFPPNTDREAARRLWSLRPQERLGALRRLAYEGTKSSDPLVRATAFLLLDAVANHEPARFVWNCGLSLAGRAGQHKPNADLSWRDPQLRSAFRSSFSGMTPREAARAMIASFAAYETRRWPRDRASGRLPEAGPEMLWAAMLRRSIHLPRTAQHLAAILSKIE